MNIPDHTVTFALCAYGQLLVERHRLAMRLGASLEPDEPVWNNQAFVLAPTQGIDPAGRDITAAQLEDPCIVPLIERAAAIKALAALLRFAYLADAAVTGVRLLGSPTKAGVPSPRLQTCFGDETVYELRGAGDVDGRVVILQGGNPDSWFDAVRWAAVAPLYRSSRSPTPLSDPGRFAARDAALLSRLGARRIRGNLWAPPAGSAVDDLEGLVGAVRTRGSQASLTAPLRRW